MTPWTGAVVPIAESVDAHRSWRVTTVVTASGGGWKDDACAMAVWICRNLMKPMAVRNAATAARVMIIRFAMEKPPSALDDAALN